MKSSQVRSVAPSMAMFLLHAAAATLVEEAAAPALDVSALQRRLHEIAVDRAKFYSCDIAIGVQTGSQAIAASSDGNVDKYFVWGSVTKMLTGSGVLLAQEQGKFSIDEPAHKYLDPALQAIGLGPMTTLFGPQAAKITARHLGSMQAGVPDYDTAKPWPRPPMDPFRAQVYATPTKEWDPVDILNVSWVSTGSLDFPPGSKTSYSSTNFVLLGLLLSQLNNAPSWDKYDQLSALSALPASRYALYKDSLKLAVHGAPKDWTSIAGYGVHGFDRTSYNGQNASSMPGHDNYAVKGVYGGWTASDVTAKVSATARLAYDIFGASGPRALKPPSVATMVPHNGAHTFPYGFATFNLSRSWGVSAGADKNYNQAYGHLGATYGYQSIVLYFPAADVALSIASNIETDNQVQPSDAACVAYNAVLAAVRNTTEPQCEFKASGYYGGYCDCGNNYKCYKLFKQCRPASTGDLSKEDCEAVC